MHVYIVITHPAEGSFTRQVMREFMRGLKDAGHTFEVGDLHATGFRAVMNREEYRREAGVAGGPPALEVQFEQEKIARADALALIYPLWWGDAPARLKGWFDRVFTVGFAYRFEDGAFKPLLTLKKALVITSAGDTNENLERGGLAAAMRRVMLDNRLRGCGVAEAEMVILGGMEGGDDALRQRHLETAYRLGKTL
ncbi:MAG: NAD(P)H-dependent oxidoreductase [Anaerolineae bacterium]|nr:NAD(P)H-dependent oxidoreductase [Anaerolineae bacterium]